MQIRRTRKTVNVKVSWEYERTSEAGSSCIRQHFLCSIKGTPEGGTIKEGKITFIWPVSREKN